MSAVAVDSLSLAFGAARILENVSFAVPEGATFGLVGESGSGKSTILRCIAGLYDHWTGRIELEGRPIDPVRTRERCRQVQMVFQDPYGSLHPRHTVNQTLSEPLQVHGIGEVDRRVDEVLTQVGLGPRFRYRFPHQLSGGQRQRVAIARALILRPRILLLDEPTSALDVSVQAEVLNLLADIQKRERLTFVLVSHDLAVVAHVCERIAVMQHGRIVETMLRSQLASGAAATAYTRLLIEASKHYDRDLARRASAIEDEITVQGSAA